MTCLRLTSFVHLTVSLAGPAGPRFAGASTRTAVGSDDSRPAAASSSERTSLSVRIEEGHLLPDHVHMVIAIRPKYAVSQVSGFIKGKSTIHLAGVYGEHRRNFVGQHFWARGYFVSTVGRDEQVIREYIRKQERSRHATGSTGPLALTDHRIAGPQPSGRVSDPALPEDSFTAVNSVRTELVLGHYSYLSWRSGHRKHLTGFSSPISI
jgi:REP element-mobilizing transposase RayT